MHILAGLGNPGPQYAAHRHNIGFMVADAIARHHNFPQWSSKFSADVASSVIGSEKVLLIKPQTFMNRSGQAIGEALRYFRQDLSSLTVFYDEIDLDAGKLRIKTGGGSGGHNGIRSIDAHCGTDYRRVRIGIGHPGSKEAVSGHVLGNFSQADRKWVDPLLRAMAENVSLLLSGEDSSFMNKISLAIKPAFDEGDTEKATPREISGAVKHRPPASDGGSDRQSGRSPTDGPMAAMLKRFFRKD